jgi:hypothetical protein
MMLMKSARSRKACRTALLSAAAICALSVSGWAQQTAHIDQRALLEQTRKAYYQPIERGVQGFSCTVAFDWSDVLERASGRRIPAKEPTLVALKNATVTVTDDLIKGPVLKVDYPGGAATVSQAVLSREKILHNLVVASLSGWNPFLSDRIFPMEGTKYHFEAMPTGYRLTLEGGTFFSILDLDPKLMVTHGESHLKGVTTDFTPTFDPSSHGWLITSLKTVAQSAVSSVAEAKAGGSSSSGAASGAAPELDEASFTFSYQFVDDMLVPKKVVVQYGEGIETPYELRDCLLVKTNGTAESKAASAKP